MRNNRSAFAPTRRRRSPLPILLLLLLALLIGGMIWLSNRNTEVPTQQIEQDVTNAVAR
jgi:sensor domain CHASE-containing protein